MKLNYKIVITGGSGRFGSVLQKKYKSNKLFYPNKKQLNILSLKSSEKYLKKTKPKILIHLAGLSRPMKIHDSNISKSVDLNIIGTANIVKICSKLKIKLIYFSITLSTKSYSSIYIPEGFAHGFCSLDKENIVYYGCSKYREKNYEIGIKWNDQDLNIKWPIKKPILSKKDSHNISFKEYCNKYN